MLKLNPNYIKYPFHKMRMKIIKRKKILPLILSDFMV